MKKLIALLLSLMMLISLAACSSKKQDKDEGDTGKTADTEIKSEEVKNEDTEKQETASDAGDITFTELVAVDNEYCVIKIKSIDPENIWGYTLKAEFENKSADMNYTFAVDSASINGVECDPFFASEVAAGKKSNEEISFNTDVLEENGVGVFTDIELTFRVYDADDWTADDVVYETVNVYPYGENKAVKFEREDKDTDNKLIDTDDVTVIVTGYRVDELWGYTADIFLVNKTDKNLMFSADNVSVNGYMADPYFGRTVAADTCTFTSVNWGDDVFEENGIDEVEEIELTLNVYDSDDWSADYLLEETFVLNP